MSVRCTKCGEQLLGAVNRCWKCGQIFAGRPSIEGQPPVRRRSSGGNEPLQAVVLEDEDATVAPAAMSQVPSPFAPPFPPAKSAAPISTADRIESQRQRNMAMGGTVASLVLAVFSLSIAAFRFEAALIAALGMAMGIWGLYSPRRRLALMGMLLCWLAIGLGTYTGARQLYIYIQKNRPTTATDQFGTP